MQEILITLNLTYNDSVTMYPKYVEVVIMISQFRFGSYFYVYEKLGKAN